MFSVQQQGIQGTFARSSEISRGERNMRNFVVTLPQKTTLSREALRLRRGHVLKGTRAQRSFPQYVFPLQPPNSSHIYYSSVPSHASACPMFSFGFAPYDIEVREAIIFNAVTNTVKDSCDTMNENITDRTINNLFCSKKLKVH